MLAVIRLVLTALLAVLFVVAMAGVFSSGTGMVEKVVLACAALLIALAVSSVWRLGTHAPH
jgi:hypothetical protein